MFFCFALWCYSQGCGIRCTYWEVWVLVILHGRWWRGAVLLLCLATLTGMLLWHSTPQFDEWLSTNPVIPYSSLANTLDRRTEQKNIHHPNHYHQYHPYHIMFNIMFNLLLTYRQCQHLSLQRLLRTASSCGPLFYIITVLLYSQAAASCRRF